MLIFPVCRFEFSICYQCHSAWRISSSISYSAGLLATILWDFFPWKISYFTFIFLVTTSLRHNLHTYNSPTSSVQLSDFGVFVDSEASMFSSKMFLVLPFTFRLLVHFSSFLCVAWACWGPHHPFACRYPTAQHHVLEIQHYYFFYWIVWATLLKINWPQIWGLTSGVLLHCSVHLF